MSTDPPRTVVEASGQVASNVVAGLVGTPALLVIVVLNVMAIAGACWFLSKLADATATRTERMMQMISDCMRERHQT